jgi:uncharacterized protein (TIGR02246 family)
MQRLIGILSATLCAAASAITTFAQEKPAEGPAARQEVLTLLTRLETSFNSGDAKKLAACWTENGEFVGPGGARAIGREAIEKLFTDNMAARKDSAKLQIHVTNLRLVNDSLALVEATAEIKPAVTTGGAPLSDFVLVKQNDRWLIENAHEIMTHLPPQANHLKELDWLLGEWSSETSKAGITLHSTCDWTSNQAFMIRRFTVEGKEIFLHGGTEVVGWDPRTNRIRSWVFDSDGGFGENVWVHDGKRWLVKFSGTLADGSQVSATHVVTKVDAGTFSLQSKDRIVNGAAQPDIPEVEMKRQVATTPTPKVEESPKPTEKPQDATKPALKPEELTKPIDRPVPAEPR